jgi:hypothetical protein
VAVGDEGDTVEGYDIVVGGGFGTSARIGRELWKDVAAEDCPALIESLLRAYLARRHGPDESFQAFTTRHEIEALRTLVANPSPLVGEGREGGVSANVSDAGASPPSPTLPRKGGERAVAPPKVEAAA